MCYLQTFKFQSNDDKAVTLQYSNSCTTCEEHAVSVCYKTGGEEEGLGLGAAASLLRMCVRTD